MTFNDDGTKMYIVGDAGNDKVFEYSLDNPTSPTVCVNDALLTLLSILLVQLALVLLLIYQLELQLLGHLTYLPFLEHRQLLELMLTVYH